MLGYTTEPRIWMVDDGVVEVFNLEKPGRFEVSSAEKMLQQL